LFGNGLPVLANLEDLDELALSASLREPNNALGSSISGCFEIE